LAAVNVGENDRLVADLGPAQLAADANHAGVEQGLQESLLVSSHRRLRRVGDNAVHIHLTRALGLEQVRSHALNRGAGQGAAAGGVDRHKSGTAVSWEAHSRYSSVSNIVAPK